MFDISIEKAKSKATIKRVLEYLSENENAIMAEISKTTRMPAATVNISRFRINNMLLGGGDFTRINTARIKPIEQDLLKAKTELGIAKEYEIREKLKSRFGFEFIYTDVYTMNHHALIQGLFSGGL